MNYFKNIKILKCILNFTERFYRSESWAYMLLPMSVSERTSSSVVDLVTIGQEPSVVHIPIVHYNNPNSNL